MEEAEVEDMEIGELDMDAIERECAKVGEGYARQEQVALLQKAIIRSKASQDLGISAEPSKGSKRKTPEENLKRG